jgi:prevent-host-death family protein
MTTISASDANRHFSALLQRVRQGESITILSRGRPAAVLKPVEAPATAVRSLAREALLRRLQQQPITGSRQWIRDALYDD